MTRSWKSVLKADLTAWLLEPDNPCIRYLTLRDLLDYVEDKPEVRDAKAAIGSCVKVSEILRKQKPEGYWESAEQPYLPKYRSSYWQVIILSLMGLDKSYEQIRKACEHIFQFQLREGGFSSFGKDGAKREYSWIQKRASAKGRQIPAFEEWASSKIHEYQMSCLTGNVAAALMRLGYTDDSRVQKALNWLADVQNVDGGWLCPYWGAHIKDEHGCFMGTIGPLEAFSELPREYVSPRIRAAIDRGAEFLLMHRLFKADHHKFKVIKESWLKLSFPCFFYDILRGLSVLTKLGYANDERIDDALDIVLQKQTADGKWILESTPTGRMQTNLEREGAPSKWITLNALKAIKRVYSNRTL